MPTHLRPSLAIILVFLLAFTAGIPGLSAQNQPPAKLNIQIIEGEDAINNIRLRTGREPIVEVTDENHKPVAGAVVLFSTPTRGASGVFEGGANSLSVTTDAQGRAVGRGFQPNAAKGRFSISVSASIAGVTAATAIRQVNRGGGLFVPAKVLIVVAVAAAGATAAGVAATRGGGGGGAQPPVLSPGSPTVGAPR